ncbi:MAG TPA: glycosyltransferase family 4 protein [Gaiellaceae bacterium]|nr:glycosyltransferase family 4 protein [Gaiellaceae bacterium]
MTSADGSWSAARERLGVYIDAVYWVDGSPPGGRVSTDRSFLLFVVEVGRDFDRLILFGRTVRGEGLADYVLPPEVTLVELPHYPNLRRISSVARAAAGTVRTFWSGLPSVDVVWLFGPHPFAATFAVLALVRRKRIVLGVRQNSVELYRKRVVGWKRVPALAAVHLVDGAFRLLARHGRVTVQGPELARRYGAPRPNVLELSESVVRAADIVAAPPRTRDAGTVDLLTVGRLEAEKNPLLLVDALARLEEAQPGRFRLTWVGRGPLEREVLQRICEHGLEERVTVRSYVPFGPELLGLYREADLFVHVSLSEGVPKVVIEAFASATPVVATDVGGVRAMLDDGGAGLLVPPADLDALAAAVRRLADSPELQAAFVERGLELVRGLTLEAQADRVTRFLRAGADRRATPSG